MALHRVAFALLAGQLAPAVVALSFAQDPAPRNAREERVAHGMFTKDQLALRLPPFLPPGQEELKDLPSTTQPTTVAAPVDEAAPVGEGDEHCGKLSAKLEEQLGAVLARRRGEGHESRPLAWTIIDSSYAAWALDQQAQLESAAKLPFVVFVAVDLNKSVARELCQQGLPTIDFSVEYSDVRGGVGGQLPIDWTTKYRVAKAKFLLPVYLLEHDVANIFVEGDVFWLRDPVPYFESALRVPAGHLVPKAKPSILVPTHHNDPYQVNIGLWYVPQGAHKDLGAAFKLMWNLMTLFYTKENSNSPYNLFDQGVFIDVLGSVFVEPSGLLPCSEDIARRIGIDAIGEDRYCKEIETARSRFVTLGGRKLRSDLIDCNGKAVWNDETLATHVLAGQPLSNAQTKFALAKLQGAFIGRPSYYENLPSPTKTRFIAWDGDYLGATLEQNYCKYPLFRADPCGPAVALPLMTALGQRLRREVVLPQIVDMVGWRRPAEQFFDAIHFQQEFGVIFRESSFLYNRRLNTTNMYPVARLRVTTEGWAAVQRITKEGSAPTTDFYSVPIDFNARGHNSGEGIAAILTALAEVPGVSDAKLILLRFANAVDGRLNEPSYRSEQVAQLQGPSAQQQRSSSDCFTSGFLCDSGAEGAEQTLLRDELCVQLGTKCER